MNRLIAILLFVCVCLWLQAQDVTTVSMPMAEYENMRAQMDSLKSVIRQMESENKALSDSLEDRDATVIRLKDNLITVDNQMSKERTELMNLRDSIRIQRTEIIRLNEKAASLDMVRVRYANGRLQLPYDEKKVKEAIELFNGITDESLKEQYKEVLSCLSKYGYYLRSVRELITTLQNDERRNNKFQIDQWKTDALRNINSNSYYRDSNNLQFTIYYLDDIISEAKSRIEHAKSYVDFSDLLERL